MSLRSPFTSHLCWGSLAPQTMQYSFPKGDHVWFSRGNGSREHHSQHEHQRFAHPSISLQHSMFGRVWVSWSVQREREYQQLCSFLPSCLLSTPQHPGNAVHLPSFKLCEIRLSAWLWSFCDSQSLEQSLEYTGHSRLLNGSFIISHEQSITSRFLGGETKAKLSFLSSCNHTDPKLVLIRLVLQIGWGGDVPRWSISCLNSGSSKAVTTIETAFPNHICLERMVPVSTTKQYYNLACVKWWEESVHFTVL